MRSTYILALFVLAAAATPALAAAPVFSYTGGFLYGGLESFYGPDACTNGLTDGMNSDCFDLAAGLDGKPFAIVDYTDDTGVFAVGPNHDVPPAVYDPAVAQCNEIEPDACPTSSNVLVYPLIAACFYAPDVGITGYLEVLGCGYAGTVPEGAGKVAVTAYPSLNVQFRFIVNDE